MAIDLLTPFLEDGIRNTHFFQGRLLAAEDLQTEQAAHRDHRRLLGQALGAGVASGLDVRPNTTGQQAALDIDQGLALNRLGETLRLPRPVTVTLLRTAAEIKPDAGVFRACERIGEPLVAANDGVYILLMSPASGFLERAPQSGLEANGKVIGCGNRYTVEGVQFRLQKLDLDTLPGPSDATRQIIMTLMDQPDDIPSRSKLRNLLAHLCFGTEQKAAFAVDAFVRAGDASVFASYGLLDALRATKQITDCDVPLALFFWSDTTIRFVDTWSVRRWPTPAPGSADWPLAVGGRAQVEATAALLQFQQQLGELIQQAAGVIPAVNIRAKDHFRYLPAAGLLRLGTASPASGTDLLGFFSVTTGAVTGTGNIRGVGLNMFFHGCPRSDLRFIHGARINALLRESFAYPPIDLQHTETIRVYRSWQNALALAGGAAVQPFMMFAAGYIPRSEPLRYNTARWNYSYFE